MKKPFHSRRFKRIIKPILHDTCFGAALPINSNQEFQFTNHGRSHSLQACYYHPKESKWLALSHNIYTKIKSKGTYDYVNAPYPENLQALKIWLNNGWEIDEVLSDKTYPPSFKGDKRWPMSATLKPKPETCQVCQHFFECKQQ